MALAAAFNLDAMALSVDVELEAKQIAELKAAEAEASMRLNFYIHLASFFVVLAIFGFLALIEGDLKILKITIWFAFPLVIHGVLVFVFQLNERHERKFEKN